VALATTGKCIRSFASSKFTATGKFPDAVQARSKELGQMKFFNQFEELNFLGLPVKAGPLSLAWTDVYLLKVEEHADGQKSLKWKGSPTGRLVLDLHESPPPEFPT
jgi:hypothetical protein